MTIRYKCEECGAALNINDELAGTEGSCPRCHVEFIVPSADEASAKPAAVEKPRASGALDTEDEIGDFLSSDEIPVSSAKTSVSESADSGSEDNPFEDEPPRHGRQAAAEENEENADEPEARNKKKDKPRKAGKEPKSDSNDSAAIARNLMGKGAAPAIEEEAEPDKKKKRRQFGAGSDRPEGEITSVGDVIKYFAKMGWPAVVGAVVVAGLSVWLYRSMQKKLDLPPLANVTGTVTIDGKPVASGTIVKFLPQDAVKNTKLANSIGITDPDGKYSLQYAIDAPGAVIGKHWVLIDPSDPSQNIPDRYRSTMTTDVIVDVPKEGKQIDIALKSEPAKTE